MAGNRNGARLFVPESLTGQGGKAAGNRGNGGGRHRWDGEEPGQGWGRHRNRVISGHRADAQPPRRELMVISRGIYRRAPKSRFETAAALAADIGVYYGNGGLARNRGGFVKLEQNMCASHVSGDSDRIGTLSNVNRRFVYCTESSWRFKHFKCLN